MVTGGNRLEFFFCKRVTEICFQRGHHPDEGSNAPDRCGLSLTSPLHPSGPSLAQGEGGMCTHRGPPLLKGRGVWVPTCTQWPWYAAKHVSKWKCF